VTLAIVPAEMSSFRALRLGGTLDRRVDLDGQFGVAMPCVTMPYVAMPYVAMPCVAVD